MFSRWLSTTLVAAQLCAVSHLVLVPHTATASGGVASSVYVLEQHLDAATHPGAHLHTAAVAAGQGEEHCAVLGLLRSATSAPDAAALLISAAATVNATAAPHDFPARSRRELLLAAPKASPPV